MRPKTFNLTLATPDADGISVAQQLGGAGNLTITGALASGGVATLGTKEAHQVGIASAGNLSALTFTVTGTDVDGRTISEAIAGPNNNTVETTKYFKTVTQVAVNGAVGTDVTVGTVDEIQFKTIPLDFKLPYFVYGFQVDISGTISYTVIHTMNNVLAGDVPTWFDHDTVVNKTVDVTDNYVIPVAATSVKINSYTAGATLAFSLISR